MRRQSAWKRLCAVILSTALVMSSSSFAVLAEEAVTEESVVVAETAEASAAEETVSAAEESAPAEQAEAAVEESTVAAEEESAEENAAIADGETAEAAAAEEEEIEEISVVSEDEIAGTAMDSAQQDEEEEQILENEVTEIAADAGLDAVADDGTEASLSIAATNKPYNLDMYTAYGYNSGSGSNNALYLYQGTSMEVQFNGYTLENGDEVTWTPSNKDYITIKEDEADDTKATISINTDANLAAEDAPTSVNYTVVVMNGTTEKAEGTGTIYLEAQKVGKVNLEMECEYVDEDGNPHITPGGKSIINCLSQELNTADYPLFYYEDDWESSESTIQSVSYDETILEVEKTEDGYYYVQAKGSGSTTITVSYTDYAGQDQSMTQTVIVDKVSYQLDIKAGWDIALLPGSSYETASTLTKTYYDASGTLQENVAVNLSEYTLSVSPSSGDTSLISCVNGGNGKLIFTADASSTSSADADYDITVTTTDGITISTTVWVYVVDLYEISLKWPSEYSLLQEFLPGETRKLTSKAQKFDVECQKYVDLDSAYEIKYSTDDSSVATVAEDGSVTATSINTGSEDILCTNVNAFLYINGIQVSGTRGYISESEYIEVTFNENSGYYCISWSEGSGDAKYLAPGESIALPTPTVKYYSSKNVQGQQMNIVSVDWSCSGGDLLSISGNTLTANANVSVPAGSTLTGVAYATITYTANDGSTVEDGDGFYVFVCNHSWKVNSTAAATCTTAGYQKEYCTVKECEASRTVTLPATGHNYVTVEDTAATCGSAGQRHEECTNCHDKKEQEVIPATGQHTWSTWTTASAATVYQAEEQTRSCSACGYTETQMVGTALPATVSLNVSGTIPAKLGQSFTVTASGLAAGDSIASWTSSNTSVATVKNGKITATKTKKMAGKTATITVTTAAGAKASFVVKTQKKDVATSKITGLQKTVTIQKGKTLKLTPTVVPITSKNKVTYKSSNKKIATVSSNGTIKGVKAGTAKITVKSGKKKVTVTVKVQGAKTTAITNVKTSLTLKKGKSTTLKPKLTPSNSSDTITYSSSNKKVATVNKKGKITAKKPGTATITVKSGSIKVTCKVTVTK